MFIILLLMKLVWSVVISKSFIMAIKSEEDLSNNPSELVDKCDQSVIVIQLIYKLKILEYFFDLHF